jgi:rare lipoprotein A (peptidoglycan hydrolase)
LRDRTHTVTGVLRPGRSGRPIALEKYYPGSGWKQIASSQSASDGTYRLAWTPVALGSFSLRVRFKGDTYNLSDTAAVPGGVNVYRATVASWYGPGLFGNRTACGQILRSDTQGVAHKTLSCGTQVRFYYRGRTKVVPVIDRGPYVNGRTWDLTYATKQSLGFPDGVDTVWSTR